MTTSARNGVRNVIRPSLWTALTLVVICGVQLENQVAAQQAQPPRYYADRNQPACGADVGSQGPDFRTFRQLARPAINAQDSTLPNAIGATPATVASGVALVDHEAPVRRPSPPANRIPSEIVDDPDVATIRLISSDVPGMLPQAAGSDELEPALPRRLQLQDSQPIPTVEMESRANASNPVSQTVDTRRPIPHAVARDAKQRQDLLARLIDQNATSESQKNPICASHNTRRSPEDVGPEPFSSGEAKSWDISSRRPRTTQTQVFMGASGEMAPPTPQVAEAPLPTEPQAVPMLSAETKTQEMFWVQPPRLGFATQSNPTPRVDSPATSSRIAEAPQRRQKTDARRPAEFVLVTAEEPKKLSDEKEGIETTKNDASKQQPRQKWSRMPIPGRPVDNSVEKVEPAEPKKMQPRKWAGLFVEDIQSIPPSESQLVQISFDAPIADTAKPGDIMLVQASEPVEKPKRRRSRLRLDFLDDPDEIADDPTSDAVKALLGEEGNDDKASSILDDDLDEEQSYKEKYSYAFEEIEPKPIQKRRTNYAPSLKDVLAENQTDPWVEQAYCNAVWACAGGRYRSALERAMENRERNRQVLGLGIGGAAAQCDRCNGTGCNGCQQQLPWGISPTRPRPGITNCRIVQGGGWCTGACGGHCDIGCKVVCPAGLGGVGCTNSNCTDDSCTGCIGESCTK